MVISRDDPLYGVLSEEQVGIDTMTGRRIINPEVLQNMREYLLAAEGGEKRVRIERVRNSVMELQNDPVGQRDFLRLEAPPKVTSNVDFEKGRVFGYGLKNVENQIVSRRSEGVAKSPMMEKEQRGVASDPLKGKDFDPPLLPEFFECSTGFSSGYAEANSSGTSRIKGGRRYRPPKRLRRFKPRLVDAEREDATGKDDGPPVGKQAAKRRAEAVAGEFTRVARRVEETIGETWNRARGIGNLSIVDSIGAVRKSLGKWKRDNNLNSNEHMKKLRHELELETSSTAPCWERVGELNVEINKAFKEEEDFWVQKSRDKWNRAELATSNGEDSH
ncbi:hypothetical protein Rs2_16312 [Raphanus sativus]|nr:hypothetical protein Rs2_16312 [Raphanus sativus]